MRRIILGAVVVGLSMLGLTAFADNNDQTITISANSTASQQAQQQAQSADQAKQQKAQQQKQNKQNMAKVDINSADAAALAKVRGISDKKAQAIVAYRDQNGAFKSVQDLKNITNANGKPLFSNKSIARLQNRLTVGTNAAANNANANANQNKAS